MSKNRRFLIIITLFLIAITSLSARTLLLNTLDHELFKDLPLEEKRNIIAAENGLMDTVFDAGWIFFNHYSLNSYANDGERFMALHLAKRMDAQYLIKMEIDEDSEVVKYELFKVNPASVFDEGEITFSDIDPDSTMTLAEYYYEVGVTLASKLIEYCER